MTKEIFTLSENAKLEYSCTVVQIGEVKPVEGSDFLGSTLVNGNPIVVRKDQIKEGDIMIYAPIETVLNKQFLSVNNLFEIGEKELNSNFKEVQALINEGKKEDAKKKVGFFNKHGRVKLIRLRGCPSMGFLIEKESLVKWKPKLQDVDFSQYVDKDFDTIDGELFVKVYVPYVPPVRTRDKSAKRNKKLKRFSRLIEGEFKFHYDTQQLARNIHLIKPDDKVLITNKLHGTSFICANILTKKPVQLSNIQKLFNKMSNKKIKKLKKQNTTRYADKKRLENQIKQYEKIKKPTYTVGYGNIYSSRTVIKNQYINSGVNSGFYGVDIWGIYDKIMKPYIPQGMTLYGEICGYLDATGKMIQKGYDYGCKVGENFLMPYRITTTKEDHTKKEWTVKEVYDWTVKLLKEHPELKKNVRPITILYSGTLKDLYPEISVSDHWHENVLETMRNDKEHFGMEELEPECINKVPREGIVLRIMEDPVAEAFKLKSFRFLDRERSEMDKGQVDMEMADAYTEQ